MRPKLYLLITICVVLHENNNNNNNNKLYLHDCKFVTILQKRKLIK